MERTEGPGTAQFRLLGSQHLWLPGGGVSPVAEAKATGRGLGWKEGNVREDGALSQGIGVEKEQGSGKGPWGAQISEAGGEEKHPEGDGEGKGTFREEEELKVSGVRGARRRLWPNTSEASEMGWKMCSSIVTSGY